MCLLGQIKVKMRSNEIVAILKLFDMFEIKEDHQHDKILGCENRIAEITAYKKANNMFAVRKNQEIGR